MTAAILFHPQLKAIDALRIAKGQGRRMVWRADRNRIKQAMQHNAQAAAAIEAEDYDAALGHLRAAHETALGDAKEEAPCLA